MQKEVEIDLGYELYQIIMDFDNPLQIFREAFQNAIDAGATRVYCNVGTTTTLGIEQLTIEVWNNGDALPKEKVSAFFGLAKSTKIDQNRNRIGSNIGYKGHGTKIFFNSEEVEIVSKNSEQEIWATNILDPIKQIRDTGIYKYSEFYDPDEEKVSLLNEFEKGFYLRITNPRFFKTDYTQDYLNHINLRDYIAWFTVFGTVTPIKFKNDVKLFLKGLSIENFKRNFSDLEKIDPVPVFYDDRYEEISLGHYFPAQRINKRDMENYEEEIGQNKGYHHYFSKNFDIENSLGDGVEFKFIASVEGYETRRRYNILLKRRGPLANNGVVPSGLQYSDAERYGFWACKNGIPIEKVDDWIDGGKGVGSYTFLKAFIDCDAFELTANRGSVRNTNIEIKQRLIDYINRIITGKEFNALLGERKRIEEEFKKIRSVKEDSNELTIRFSGSRGRRLIKIPNKQILYVPMKGNSRPASYSESEVAILFTQIITLFPDLFKFKLLDYNTNKGIDFVVNYLNNPKYIELKGTLRKDINHSFRNIWKFVCYDIDISKNGILTDIEGLNATLEYENHVPFESDNDDFHGKLYRVARLRPSNTTAFDSIEVIILKNILTDVIGAQIDS
jgi:hypothetical protein